MDIGSHTVISCSIAASMYLPGTYLKVDQLGMQSCEHVVKNKEHGLSITNPMEGRENVQK